VSLRNIVEERREKGIKKYETWWGDKKHSSDLLAVCVPILYQLLKLFSVNICGINGSNRALVSVGRRGINFRFMLWIICALRLTIVFLAVYSPCNSLILMSIMCFGIRTHTVVDRKNLMRLQMNKNVRNV